MGTREVREMAADLGAGEVREMAAEVMARPMSAVERLRITGSKVEMPMLAKVALVWTRCQRKPRPREPAVASTDLYPDLPAEATHPP